MVQWAVRVHTAYPGVINTAWCAHVGNQRAGFPSFLSECYSNPWRLWYLLHPLYCCCACFFSSFFPLLVFLILCNTFINCSVHLTCTVAPSCLHEFEYCARASVLCLYYHSHSERKLLAWWYMYTCTVYTMLYIIYALFISYALNAIPKVNGNEMSGQSGNLEN